MIAQIKLEMICPNPFQTRMSEDAEHVRKLAVSIADYGLLQIPAGRLLDANGEPVGILEVRSQAGDLISGDILEKMGVSAQLAFGHSRFAAYKLLNQLQKEWLENYKLVDQPEELVRAVTDSLDNGQVFFEMPVNLSDLLDEDMFSQAVLENLDRKDLSPIEEAQAMTVYRDHFGKTSPEIGQLFHLSDSAVRNKMRLLKLPEEIKAKLQAGEVSELAARGILSLFELPDQIRQKAENVPDWMAQARYRPSFIVQEMLSGEASVAETASRIKWLQETYTANLSAAEWKITDVFVSDGVASENCKNCPNRIIETNRCLAPDCYKIKQALYQQNYLQKASAASGFPIDEREDIPDYRLNWIGDYGKRDQALQLRASKCPNLAIRYDASKSSDFNLAESTLRDLGYPKAAIVCLRQEQFCSCRNGLKALAEAARRHAMAEAAVHPAQSQAPEPAPVEELDNPEDVDIQGLREGDVEDEVHDHPNWVQEAANGYLESEPAGDPDHPGERLEVAEPPTAKSAAEPTLAEQLQQAAHEERVRKKKNAALVKKATHLAGQMFGFGLAALNPALWLEVAGMINYALGSSEMQGKSFSELAMAIGEYLATRTIPYDPSELDIVLRNINALLKAADIREITQGDLEEYEELPPQPKSLAQVFEMDLDTQILPKF